MFSNLFKNRELFERIFIVFLVAVTVFLRFYQLGYFHFYGDETKTLYWNKTVPAKEFLLDQRKGPIQFIATWFIETITGGFDELTVRLPFAFAGTLSFLIFYLILKRLFSKRVGYIGAFFYLVLIVFL